MSKQQLGLRIGFYGLLLSGLIGGISFVFIYLESHLASFLWHGIQETTSFTTLITFLFCLVGGLLIGFLKSQWGDYPIVAHETIDQLKKHKTVHYKPVFKNLTIALFILIFGAGVGPEAALLSSIVMLSVWQADKLRYLFFNQETFIQLKPHERISRMIHPTNYLVTYKEEFAPNHPQLGKAKIIMNTLFSINGLISFFILMKLTEQPSFISKLGSTNWKVKDLLLFIPLMILGLIAGILYNVFKKKMVIWFDFWHEKPIKKALIGSAAIFLIGIFLPNLLFSGQTSLGAIPDKYLAYSFLILLGAVILKLVFLQVCLNTGWVGGDIFPIVFAAILYGFTISLLFPSFDPLFITATVATTMALTILNSPIGISLFVALFFPIKILPIILLIAALFMIFDKVIKPKFS